ncbi:MAG TPA: metalloregulator ArsR/SmtB family transcription factor [Geminicoccus sp.]|jgi:DNA-binding transcriptional ArsR family regulator|uniref:ArsR/SmtB family transcription factor n=1 Tax=Geminicoccus sp. TaxID=2024832 RepID=UPI002E310425|nr:metalloregulator ArsR/SmtB family transcription factor [Geminicoccus sp.]HEX2525160.1 metalloregulator ArsR/SmtB family transcription factor [Geminicoccus sp.]
MKQPHHPPIDGIGLTEVLGALSDPVRLSIVATLADGEPRSCGAFELPVVKSTLSHHLKVLREAGIIASRMDGTRCFLTLRPELEDRFPGLLAHVLRLAGQTSPAA